ncbi:DUF3310 domain-containing protein [Yersinia ruckeri]|uniref:DUF3310 domain-containing protein n=1 Tax=Yersinia ruckeri TaxID=29486 RepID=UPI0022387FB9|nr:DUF3310 domain-containing protein [Yersinia ruckeri]MCW6550345.1 DUF3310 domain-containing protein [Yersinia ruckeri]
MAEFKYIKGSASDFEGAPDWATLKTTFDDEHFCFVQKHVHGGRIFSINEQKELEPITNISGDFSSAKIISQRERMEYGHLNDLPLVSEKYPNRDVVNHPSHYTQGGVECIDAIKAALTEEQYEGYLRGACIKYLWRYKLKGGVESLKKSEWYLERLIKLNEEIESRYK